MLLLESLCSVCLFLIVKLGHDSQDLPDNISGRSKILTAQFFLSSETKHDFGTFPMSYRDALTN